MCTGVTGYRRCDLAGEVAQPGVRGHSLHRTCAQHPTGICPNTDVTDTELATDERLMHTPPVCSQVTGYVSGYISHRPEPRREARRRVISDLGNWETGVGDTRGGPVSGRGGIPILRWLARIPEVG